MEALISALLQLAFCLYGRVPVTMFHGPDLGGIRKRIIKYSRAPRGGPGPFKLFIKIQRTHARRLIKNPHSKVMLLPCQTFCKQFKCKIMRQTINQQAADPPPAPDPMAEACPTTNETHTIPAGVRWMKFCSLSHCRRAVRHLKGKQIDIKKGKTNSNNQLRVWHPAVPSVFSLFWTEPNPPDKWHKIVEVDV